MKCWGCIETSWWSCIRELVSGLFYHGWLDSIAPILEKEMATHSNILAWRIPGTEEPSAIYGVAQSWTRLKWLSSSSPHFGFGCIMSSDHWSYWENGIFQLIRLLEPSLSPNMDYQFLNNCYIIQANTKTLPGMMWPSLILEHLQNLGGVWSINWRISRSLGVPNNRNI